MTYPHEFTPIVSLRDDPTVPAVVRSTITDWCHRYETGVQAVATLREQLEAAKITERQAIRTAPDRVLAMLAAGKVIPDRIAPDLDQCRTAVRAADDRYRATRTAMDRLRTIAVRCFESAGADMVPWIAHHRVSVGRFRSVPEPVVHAWSVVGASARIHLPAEAWLETVGDVTIYHRPTGWPSLSGHRRDWWAWNMLEAGNVTVTTDGPVTVFTITAPWTGGLADDPAGITTGRSRRR
jgi:hypothetical protein